MKNKCLHIHVLVLIVALCFTGCAVSPNLVDVTKGGIKAYGSIFGVFKKHEQIELIEISPRDLSYGQTHDLCIGFSLTNQMTFAEITESGIKGIGVSATNYYSAASPDNYFVDGYSFDFKGVELIGFTANLYGYPPKK